MFMDVVPVNDEIREMWQSARGKEFKEDTIRLNILLNLLFETKKFKKMTAKQMYLAAIVDKPVSDICDYSRLCVRQIIEKQRPEREVIYTDHPEEFVKPNAMVNTQKGNITSIRLPNGTFVRSMRRYVECDNPEPFFNQLKEILLTRFAVDITKYATLPQIGYELLVKNHCFDNVYQLSGKPADFIRACAPKILLGTAFGEHVRKL